MRRNWCAFMMMGLSLAIALPAMAETQRRNQNDEAYRRIESGDAQRLSQIAGRRMSTSRTIDAPALVGTARSSGPTWVTLRATAPRPGAAMASAASMPMGAPAASAMRPVAGSDVTIVRNDPVAQAATAEYVVSEPMARQVYVPQAVSAGEYAMEAPLGVSTSVYGGGVVYYSTGYVHSRPVYVPVPRRVCAPVYYTPVYYTPIHRVPHAGTWHPMIRPSWDCRPIGYPHHRYPVFHTSIGYRFGSHCGSGVSIRVRF